MYVVVLTGIRCFVDVYSSSMHNMNTYKRLHESPSIEQRMTPCLSNQNPFALLGSTPDVNNHVPTYKPTCGGFREGPTGASVPVTLSLDAAVASPLQTKIKTVILRRHELWNKFIWLNIVVRSISALHH